MLLVSQGKSPDAAAPQVDEETNVAANGNAVNGTGVCSDLFSISGFRKGWEVGEHREAQLQKFKGKAPN